MNRIVAIVIALMAPLFASFAQDKAIETVNLKLGKVGFFVAPTISVESINKTILPSIGGKAGLIVNKSLGAGLFGQTLIQDETLPVFNNTNLELDFTQGGLFLEYTLNPNKAFHLTFPLNIGMGRLKKEFANDDIARNAGSVNPEADNPFGIKNFVFVEPGIGLELNLHQNIRAFTVVSYRLTNNFQYLELNGREMNGLNGTFGLKFGIF